MRKIFCLLSLAELFAACGVRPGPEAETVIVVDGIKSDGFAALRAR